MVEGITPTGPDDKKIFASQFQQGTKIFEDSLDEYHQIKPNGDEIDTKKKSLFNQAMDDSLKAMKDSCSMAFGEDIKAKEKKLEDDYKAFINNETDESYNAVKQDLQDIKNSTRQ